MLASLEVGANSPPGISPDVQALVEALHARETANSAGVHPRDFLHFDEADEFTVPEGKILVITD